MRHGSGERGALRAACGPRRPLLHVSARGGRISDQLRRSRDLLWRIEHGDSLVAVAITGLAIVIAVIVAVVALAWGRVLVKETKADAREEARTEAGRILETWLLNEAPRLIRDAIGSVERGPGGSDNSGDDEAADEMGRAAG